MDRNAAIDRQSWAIVGLVAGFVIGFLATGLAAYFVVLPIVAPGEAQADEMRAIYDKHVEMVEYIDGQMRDLNEQDDTHDEYTSVVTFPAVVNYITQDGEVCYEIVTAYFSGHGPSDKLIGMADCSTIGGASDEVAAD